MSHERANHYVGLVTADTDRIPVWRVGRLWDLAADLPIKMLPLVDLVRTLDGPTPNAWKAATPTLREAPELARHIHQVDLAYPIILSADGHVLDGAHRIAKAWMLRHETIAAVSFEVDPDPDKWIARAGLPLPAEGHIGVYIPDAPSIENRTQS